MAVTRVHFKNFTAFEDLRLEFSPGINVLIGTNGTGKTHVMKAVYAACDVSKTRQHFAEKLVRVYLPSGRALGRLVKRGPGSRRGALEVYRDRMKLRVSFSNHATVATSAKVSGAKEWVSKPLESVYIPVKEMLSHAPGFRSLYTQREIYYEEIYADILDRAYRPIPRGPLDKTRKSLLEKIHKLMKGKVTIKEEEFFLKSRQGNLEFTLLAEGMRKLGLLWLLIQNGTLWKGSVLFWDEPETNLNPTLFRHLIAILLELQRKGIQIFLATHDYVILKEIDLLRSSDDAVLFHAFYHDEKTKEIQCHSTSNYLDISPNAISEAFGDLYYREIKRSLERKK